MKVRELIEKLQRCPLDAELVSEGCDCEGDVAHVVVREGNEVVLARSNSYWSRGGESWTEIK